MSQKISKTFLHEAIDILVPNEDVSTNELREVINCFVHMDILMEHGSVPEYEEYINERYGDILQIQEGD